MAVVVAYNELGNPIIKTYGKIATNQEQQDAIKLDEQLKVAISKIDSDLVKEGLLPKIGNARPGIANETWWEVGKRIAIEIDDNPLIKSSDRNLIWDAIELHSSERIKKAPRGPNRKHVHICYRYSKFPKEKVLKVEWAEWADYFGKPALSKDARADIWIKKNIDKVTNFNRDECRGMTTYFYDHISKKGKVEMGAKTDEKFYKLWDNGFQNYLETIKENEKGD